MDVDVKFEGFEEALATLQGFASPRSANRLAKRAGRHAMKRVRKAARAGARRIDDPVTRDRIEKNIVTRTGKTKNNSYIRIRVGVQGGANVYHPHPKTDMSHLSGGDTRHWRFWEFGTSQMPADPFMRNALSQNIQAVTQDFTDKFNKEVDKDLRKYQSGKLKL